MIAAATPVDEAERLSALRASGVLDTPVEERFDRVTRLCRRLFGVDLAFVNLVDLDRQWTKSIAGIAKLPDVPRKHSFCAHAIAGAAAVVVPDTLQDDRFHDNPLVTGDPNLRFYAGVPIAGPGGHLVGALCIADSRPRMLSASDLIILEDLALWVEKEMNLDDELDRAAEVQRALLPKQPPQGTGWEVAGHCRPSREVGGDFFDWYRASDASMLTIADVMGKGMPAAIVSASVRAAMRVGGREGAPAYALEHAQASLADDLAATDTFVTAFVARLDRDGRLTYADAGHAQAAIVRAGGDVELLNEGGLPLGIDHAERYAETIALLDAGDLLFAHSDGLLDGAPVLRSTTHAAQLLRGVESAEHAVALLSALVGHESPADDVTILVARRR